MFYIYNNLNFFSVALNVIQLMFAKYEFFRALEHFIQSYIIYNSQAKYYFAWRIDVMWFYIIKILKTPTMCNWKKSSTVGNHVVKIKVGYLSTSAGPLLNSALIIRHDCRRLVILTRTSVFIRVSQALDWTLSKYYSRPRNMTCFDRFPRYVIVIHYIMHIKIIIYKHVRLYTYTYTIILWSKFVYRLRHFIVIFINVLRYNRLVHRHSSFQTVLSI